MNGAARGRRARAHRLGSTLLLLSIALAQPAGVAAHGDLHARIAAIEQQIAAEPANAEHYLRRAELHRQHREWEHAEQDFSRVHALAPDHGELPWMWARTRAESGRPELALVQLDSFIERFPDHASARLTRARTLVALERHAGAVKDFEIALARLPSPEPDYFLEQRDAQQRAGAPAAIRLAALEQALRRLGPVPSLEDAALDLELATGRFDAALARLDRQAAASPRKERWHFRRGIVLAQAGRRAEASTAFRASLAEIEKLPPQLREARASHSLVAQLREELKKLAIDDKSAAR